MPRSRKINLEQVRASLDKTCPKCGFTITPDLVKRVDFERMECPNCGERLSPSVQAGTADGNFARLSGFT
jgi:ribosomal protein S27AE